MMHNVEVLQQGWHPQAGGGEMDRCFCLAAADLLHIRVKGDRDVFDNDRAFNGHTQFALTPIEAYQQQQDKTA